MSDRSKAIDFKPIDARQLATGLVLTNRMLTLQVARVQIRVNDLDAEHRIAEELRVEMRELHKLLEQQTELLSRALQGGADASAAA